MTHNQSLIAAFFAILASALLSLTDNFVIPVSKTAGLWQFLAVRTLFGVPILAVAAWFLGMPILPKNSGRFLLRSATVSCGLLVYFATLGFLPVAQAGAGLYSAPLWVMLVSVLFLGTRVDIRRITAMLVGFLGVLILLQFDVTNLTVLSVLPLIAGALYGMGALATKYLCQDESALALSIGVFSFMGFLSLVFLLYFTAFPVAAGTEQFFNRGWEPINAEFIMLTFGQAVGASLAVSLIAQAYRLGDPAFISVCEYSFLVFAAIWAFVLWGIPASLMTLVGITVVIISGIAMFLFGQKHEDHEPSSP